MPLALAFKNAMESDSFWSKTIAKLTHGPYSHVECWVGGPIEAAICYSSRELEGTGFKTIDLSSTGLWAILPIQTTPARDAEILWFCQGSAGREYDYVSLLGIETGSGAHNTAARVCSEECLNVLQKVLGLFPGVQPWRISPNELALLTGALPTVNK